MNRYVTDTHALYWYLIGSSRLGARAKEAFDEGVGGEAVIYIPVIVLAELYFLNEKVGRPLDFTFEYRQLVNSGQFVFVSLYPEDVLNFDEDTAVPEMHDRMIVGVARRLNAVCLTRDVAVIASEQVPTQWD